MQRALFLLFLSLMVAGFAGCQAARTVSDDEMTVEGMVTVRGNEPFTAVILETDQRNFYVLTLTPEMRAALRTPARVRVTGVLYRADWNSRPYAHLRVSGVE